MDQTDPLKDSNAGQMDQARRTLKQMENRMEACYMVQELAIKITLENCEDNVTITCLEKVLDLAQPQYTRADVSGFLEVLQNPETSKYFTKYPDPATAMNAAEKYAGKKISTVKSYAASSSLVFAHSFLEHVLEDLLKMTRLCDRKRWISFIGAKTISVSDLEEIGLEEALDAKLAEFVKSIRNEGILKKIDMLSKILRTSLSASNIIGYSYDLNEVERIDNLRHSLAHHRKKDYSLERAKVDADYLNKTAWHFLALVRAHYDLHGEPRPATSSETFGLDH